MSSRNVFSTFLADALTLYSCWYLPCSPPPFAAWGSGDGAGLWSPLVASVHRLDIVQEHVEVGVLIDHDFQLPVAHLHIAKHLVQTGQRVLDLGHCLPG